MAELMRQGARFMLRPRPHSRFITLLAIACGVLACGEDGTGAGGAGSGGSGGPGGTGAGITEPGGTCTEAPLFDPQSYGDDGADMIRRIEFDDQTGDIVFSAWQELYRLPVGSDAPALMMERPPDAQPLYGDFWLAGDDLLMPAAPGVGSLVTAAIPGATTTVVPVLFQAPRTGGTAELQVSSVMPLEDQVFYQIAGARVVGDEVFWVDVRAERESFSTGAPIDRTYRAWHTSWRTPSAEPAQLYTSEFALDVPIVVNGIAYIDASNSESAQDGTTQRMIHLADGAVEPNSAEEVYGGRVIAGDEQSLIIFNSFDPETIEDFGIYRAALDGSQKERISSGLAFREWRSNAGAWGYDAYDVEAGTIDIYFYQPGSAPRLLGCVADSATTVHDVVVGPDAVYVAVYYSNSTSTILRYPL